MIYINYFSPEVSACTPYACCARIVHFLLLSVGIDFFLDVVFAIYVNASLARH